MDNRTDNRMVFKQNPMEMLMQVYGEMAINSNNPEIKKEAIDKFINI